MQIVTDKGGSNREREHGMANSVAERRGKTKELAIRKAAPGRRGKGAGKGAGQSWRPAKKTARSAKELAREQGGRLSRTELVKPTVEEPDPW